MQPSFDYCKRRIFTDSDRSIKFLTDVIISGSVLSALNLPYLINALRTLIIHKVYLDS